MESRDYYTKHILELLRIIVEVYKSSKFIRLRSKGNYNQIRNSFVIFSMKPNLGTSNLLKEQLIVEIGKVFRKKFMLGSWTKYNFKLLGDINRNFYNRCRVRFCPVLSINIRNKCTHLQQHIRKLSKLNILLNLNCNSHSIGKVHQSQWMYYTIKSLRYPCIYSIDQYPMRN